LTSESKRFITDTDGRLTGRVGQVICLDKEKPSSQSIFKVKIGGLNFSLLPPETQIRVVSLLSQLEADFQKIEAGEQPSRDLEENLHILQAALLQLPHAKDLCREIFELEKDLKSKKPNYQKALATWRKIKSFLGISIKPAKPVEEKKATLRVEVPRLHAFKQIKPPEAGSRWTPIEIDEIIKVVKDFKVPAVKLKPVVVVKESLSDKDARIYEYSHVEHLLRREGEVKIPHADEPIPITLDIFTAYNVKEGTIYADSLKIRWSAKVGDHLVSLTNPTRDGSRVFHTKNAVENFKVKLQESWKYALARLQYLEQYLNFMKNEPQDEVEVPVIYGRITRIIGKRAYRRITPFPPYEWREEKIVENGQEKIRKYVILEIDIGHGKKCPLFLKVPAEKLLKKIPLYERKGGKWVRKRDKNGKMLSLEGNPNGTSWRQITVGKWIAIVPPSKNSNSFKLVKVKSEFGTSYKIDEKKIPENAIIELF